jgi:hypothetical protein
MGLCGDKYYCEAGHDRERDDSLFVYKVESAARRPPKAIPHRYPAALYLLDLRIAARLDSTARLWSAFPQQQAPGSTVSNSLEPMRLEATASEQLLKLMGSPPRELRSDWWPRRRIPEECSAEEFIDAIRKPWAKFQLGKYVTVTTRQESLLKGLSPNLQLGSKERSRLLSLFDIALLNAYARESNARELVLFDMLRAFSTLSLPEATRARIWAATAQSLDREQILRELYDLGRFVGEESIPPEAVEDWGPPILSLLEHCAAISKDDLIAELLEECKDHAQPINTLTSWLSEHLTFDEGRAPESEVSVEAITYSDTHASPDEGRPEADADAPGLSAEGLADHLKPASVQLQE